MLDVLGVLPQQAANRQLQLHLGGGWQPAGQDTQQLVLDEPIAVEKLLVVREVNLLLRLDDLHGASTGCVV